MPTDLSDIFFASTKLFLQRRQRLCANLALMSVPPVRQDLAGPPPRTALVWAQGAGAGFLHTTECL